VSTVPRADRRRALASVLLVATVAWSAHFLHFRRFGLYEDDIYLLARQLNWSWRDWLVTLQRIVRTVYQGRPIGFLVATVVPFLCFRLGGIHALPVLYLVASAIVVTNALLAHRLFAVVYGPSFALLGALVFALYPADTTQAFLTHTLVLQPSLMLVLLALLTYVRGRRVLAYVLAAACLLTYESGVLAFFAAPLMRPTWEPGIVRRWAKHVIALLAIVTAVVALRVAAGEYRAANLESSDQGIGWSAVPARIVQSLWTGPQVNLSAYVRRPGWALGPNLDRGLVFGMAAAFAAVLAVLGTGQAFAAGLPPPAVLFRAAITGLVMLVGGYALEFSGWHFPPIYEAGRMSAVHLGATLGATLVAAAVLSLPWARARGRAPRAALAALTAFYLASLFGYRLIVQRGYVSAAQQQREYWSRIVSLVPDLSADTVVVLLDGEVPGNHFIAPSSWSDTWVLPLLFRDAGGRRPFLVGGGFSLRRGAESSGFDESLLEARGGTLRWSSALPGWVRVDRAAPLAAGKLVVLEHRGRKWKRRRGTITLQGIDVDLPPPPAGATLHLLPGPLHDLMLAPEGGGGGP